MDSVFMLAIIASATIAAMIVAAPSAARAQSVAEIDSRAVGTYALPFRTKLSRRAAKLKFGDRASSIIAFLGRPAYVIPATDNNWGAGADYPYILNVMWVNGDCPMVGLDIDTRTDRLIGQDLGLGDCGRQRRLPPKKYSCEHNKSRLARRFCR